MDISCEVVTSSGCADYYGSREGSKMIKSTSVEHFLVASPDVLAQAAKVTIYAT